MKNNREPSVENHFYGEQAQLLISSFHQLTGKHLLDPDLAEEQQSLALYRAPFAVLSHNTESDPIFNYANQTAQNLFEMDWAQFTQLASRHSAEPQVRAERERLLARVTNYGFIEDYKGVRVSASGKRFLVENAVVWNLVDRDGQFRGQAAVLYQWSEL